MCAAPMISRVCPIGNKQASVDKSAYESAALTLLYVRPTQSMPLVLFVVGRLQQWTILDRPENTQRFRCEDGRAIERRTVQKSADRI